MDGQMKRGILEMCILFQFLEKDFYGYDIMNKMKTLFTDVQDSTFYVILRRLCTQGFLVKYDGKTSGGPQRKYYRISETGKEYLEQQIINWENIKTIVQECGIK